MAQEFFGVSVELRAADSEETQAAAEELEQFLARDAVQVTAHEADLIERAPESGGLEFGEHLQAVDFFDDQRHDQHHRGTHRAQRRHQGRGRGRTVQIYDLRAHREGIDHADRTFVRMGERQHRKEYVVGLHGEDARRNAHLRAKRRMGQHHALGLGGSSRSIDDDRQIIGFGHRRRTLGMDLLGDDSEVLGADHDVEPSDGLFRKFGEKFVGDEQRTGLRMLDDHVQLFARKVRKNRHGDHAGRSDGKVADAPVGHVAAQQGHLVAGLQAGSRKDFLHLGNTTVHLGVSHVVAFEHRKCDFRRELFHAVASQFVKCIDGHNFSFSTTSE